MIALVTPDRSEGQPVRRHGGIGNGIRGGGRGECLQPGIEDRGPLVVPGRKVVRGREPEPSLGPHQGKTRSRQQEVLKAAPSAAALDPDITGAQSIAQVQENGDFPGSGVEAVFALADMAPPLAGQKREWYLWRKPFAAMNLPQQVDGGEKRVLSAERAKGESIEDKPRHRPQGSLPI